jgi:hypothetical protein
VEPGVLVRYTGSAHTRMHHRQTIQAYLGYRRTRREDMERLAAWLLERALEHETPLGQKTQTPLSLSVDDPAITRATACIPPSDTPYLLAKNATRAEVAKIHGLEALAGVYHGVGRSGAASAQ